MPVNLDVTAGRACLVCGGCDPDSVHDVILIVRTDEGPRPVHWECASYAPWPYDIAVVLQVYSDRSAAVVVMPLHLAPKPFRDRHSAVHHLNVKGVRALVGRHAAPSARVANVVYYSQLVTLELERQ